MSSESVLLDIKNGVGTIMLNRPDSANAINLDLAKALFDAVSVCDDNPDVRAVLLTGQGKLFCGGGDLGAFTASENLSSHVKLVTTYLHGAISRLSRMDAPVIAGVNGSAGGAGFSLVCACDMAIASEDAKFTMAYTAIGLSPDGSSTFYLPRIVGLRRAMELTLTNRRLNAQEALEWGIVNRVVSADDLLTEANQFAQMLAQGPTQSFGVAKRLLYQSMTESLETQMEHETQGIAEMAKTDDAREGIQAFFEKRPPNFKGLET